MIMNPNKKLVTKNKRMFIISITETNPIAIQNFSHNSYNSVCMQIVWSIYITQRTHCPLKLNVCTSKPLGSLIATKYSGDIAHCKLNSELKLFTRHFVDLWLVSGLKSNKRQIFCTPLWPGIPGPEKTGNTKFHSYLFY